MILKIYPTIDLDDGYLVAGTKYRGSFKKAYEKMINDFFNKFDIDKEFIRAGSTPGLSDEHQQEIIKLIKGHGVKEVEWLEAKAVISTHGGPGAVGFVGIEKKK